MNDKLIPIVFAFDDNYALPAWATIKSLLDNAGEARYQIYIFYTKLKDKVFDEFNSLSSRYPGHKLDWKKIDKTCFDNAPSNWAWSVEIYYRLILPDVLVQHDKIIWSDVDVLFNGNLQEIYDVDMGDCLWGGVKIQLNQPKMQLQTYFPENKNKFIFMSGFMLINAKKMREDNMTAKFMKLLEEFHDRLTSFDLDLLNLSTDKIYDVPFEYCVLENIYDFPIEQTREYASLEPIWGREALLKAKANPIIIHYAGDRAKVWRRPVKEMPANYLPYYLNNPFKVKFKALKKFGYWLMMKFSPSKEGRRSWRHALRRI